MVSPFVDRQHGTERAFAELLECLARNYGCEIHLYAQRVEDLALAGGDLRRPSGVGRIIWHRVPPIPGPHLLQFTGWFYLNRLWRWADRFFRRTSFDLVLSPGINCNDADVIVVHALFHRLEELAQEQREAPQEQGFFRRHHRRLYYRFLTRLERRIYTDPQVALATVSQRTAHLITQYFQRQDVRVIPNAVDMSEFSPSARLARRAEARRQWNFRDEDFVLLLIGNDWRAKGIYTLLEAMAALSDLPIRLLVVGSEASERFRARAKELDVLDRCHWELPRRDVLDFYSAADVYASPSYEDSFGLPVAEAMACGLPVITSTCAGVAEWIHDGVDGFVLPKPSDAPALASLIRRIFQQQDLRARLGEAGAHAAAKWTWANNAESVWRFLQESLARRRPS